MTAAIAAICSFPRMVLPVTGVIKAPEVRPQRDGTASMTAMACCCAQARTHSALTRPVCLQAPCVIRRLASKGDQAVLAQLLALEKKLFKKQDNWGGAWGGEAAARGTTTGWFLSVPLPGGAARPAALSYSANSHALCVVLLLPPL